MIFWILLAFFAAPIIGLIVGFIIAVKCEDGVAIPVFFLIGFFAAIPSIPALHSWSSHANDISKVEAQHHRITVYEERIESLEERLSGFDYPEKPTISVDADTPWATMVKSLNDAESELARAKDERAIAIRSIRARMRGPMSGVVSFVGLPDGWDE